MAITEIFPPTFRRSLGHAPEKLVLVSKSNLVFDFLPWVVFSGSGYTIATAIACWPLLMCRRAMLLAMM